MIILAWKRVCIKYSFNIPLNDLTTTLHVYKITLMIYLTACLNYLYSIPAFHPYHIQDSQNQKTHNERRNVLLNYIFCYCYSSLKYILEWNIWKQFRIYYSKILIDDMFLRMARNERQCICLSMSFKMFVIFLRRTLNQ